MFDDYVNFFLFIFDEVIIGYGKLINSFSFFYEFVDNNVKLLMFNYDNFYGEIIVLIIYLYVNFLNKKGCFKVLGSICREIFNEIR